MLEINKVHQGDCLILSDEIESGSVDLILTDLPFGNMKNAPSTWDKTNFEWDNCIEPKQVYEIANRILRKNGKMILFSQEPYTTQLINEAIPNVPFCYRAIWEKDNFANALGCNKAMVGFYEDVLVFSKMNQKHDFEGMHPLRAYFKQVRAHIEATTKEINQVLSNVMSSHYFTNGAQFVIPVERDYAKLIDAYRIDVIQGFKQYSEIKAIDAEYRQDLIKQMTNQHPNTFNLWEGKKYKSNILKYKKDYDGYHPTQKPVLLLEDLIKTFSNEGNLVVDLTCGSGSTGVACINTNRNFILIEKEPQYCTISNQRISDTLAQHLYGAMDG